jgi:uncharacterized ParB-like nuclease family protein
MDGLVNLNVSQVMANLSVQANLQNVVVNISDVLNNVQVQAVVQALNTNPQAKAVADQLTDEMRKRGMLQPNESIVGASGQTLYKLAQ